MIPAPPRISAPPRREASPGAHRPQLAPRLTTQTSPTLPPRHKRFPHGSTAVPAQPPPTRQFPALPAASSRPAPVAAPRPPPVPRPRPPRSAARLPAPAFPPAPVSGPGPRPPRSAARLSVHGRCRLFPRAMPVGCRMPSTAPVLPAAPYSPQPLHTTPRQGICRSNNSMNVAFYLIDPVERHIH